MFERDVVYGRVGETELRLNLASPSGGQTDHPAVVLLHPGGWAAGDRSIFDDLAKQFAAHGYVAATVSYRLAPQHTFPAQVQDAKCAIRFLRAHAEDLRIDSTKIAAVGASAGAHLALMLAVTSQVETFEGDGGWPEQSSAISAAVSFVGPTDLADDHLPEMSRELITTFLGGADPVAASPIMYLDQIDAPMLLFAGVEDSLIPVSQNVRFIERASEVGVYGRLELIAGVGHGFDETTMTRAIEAMFDFLDTQFEKLP